MPDAWSILKLKDIIMNEPGTGELVKPAISQDILASQKGLLAKEISALYHRTPARAEFLSGMATQLLEGKPQETVDDDRRLIEMGLGLESRNVDLWNLNKATAAKKLTPAQTRLVLEGYILASLCHSAKQAFDAIKQVAEIAGQEEKTAIQEFLPFITQVRQRAEEDTQKQIDGTLTAVEYPFHVAPETHAQELDNVMRLHAESHYNPQLREYE